MAITAETGTDVNNDFTPSSGSDFSVSLSIAIQNASGNDRLLVFAFWGYNNNANEDMSATAGPSFNGKGPDGSYTVFDSGAGTDGDFCGVYYWLDANIGGTGTRAVTLTVGNTGDRPCGAGHVIEFTGVDQTTPIASSSSNSGFDTTTQSKTAAAGNYLYGVLGGGNDCSTSGSSGGTGSFLFSWNFPSNGPGRAGGRFAGSTDTLDLTHTDSAVASENWICIELKEAVAAGTDLLDFERGVMRGLGRGISRA
jgi:hypothetical protein